MNLHRAILNILHRAILNILHRALLNILHRAISNSLHMVNIAFHTIFSISAFTGIQTHLLALPCFKYSKSRLRFEIGPWQCVKSIGLQ